MSLWRKIRYHAYIGGAIIGIPLVGGLALYQHCKSIPDATQQIGVTATDFAEPVEEAMNIWNRSAGCTIFVEGKDVAFMSTDGEPCNKAFHHNISDGHSAGAYQCNPSSPEYRGYRWEVHVERPGNLRTQTCIAIHELGHVAGFADSFDKSKAMHVEWCPPDGQILWPSDWESEDIARRFCP